MLDDRDTFPYSEEFLEAIHAMNPDLGKEGTPDWLALSAMRVEQKRRNFLPIIGRYVTLAGARVLEMGCGTAPASVVMAQAGAHVVGVDIDAAVIHAARLRVRDHGLEDRIELVLTEDTAHLPFAEASFDVAVLNGVLEHVAPHLRAPLEKELWRLLRPGGVLFIGETPNRLRPRDIHTTGLWWLHYLPANAAKWYAVKRHRLGPNDDVHALGALGCTYRRLLAPLPRNRVVLNLQPGQSWVARKRALTDRRRKRAVLALLSTAERLVLRPVCRLPVDGLMPYLTIAVRKIES